MLPKCNATGKVIFSSLLEARYVMFSLKWSYKRHKDVNGNRIKHRQGKPARRMRAYHCRHCLRYHITKWSASNFEAYLNRCEKEYPHPDGSGFMGLIL